MAPRADRKGEIGFGQGVLGLIGLIQFRTMGMRPPVGRRHAFGVTGVRAHARAASGPGGVQPIKRDELQNCRKM